MMVVEWGKIIELGMAVTKTVHLFTESEIIVLYYHLTLLIIMFVYYLGYLIYTILVIEYLSITFCSWQIRCCFYYITTTGLLLAYY